MAQLALRLQDGDHVQPRPELTLIGPTSPHSADDWIAYVHAHRYEIGIRERLSVVSTLREAWKAQRGPWSRHRINKLAELAEWLCDWPLLATVTSAALRTDLGPSKELVARHVQSLWQTTDYQGALSILNRQLLLRSGCETIQSLVDGLHTWMEYSWQVCQGCYNGLADGPLILEPLGHHHARSFLWQYQESNIPERCCLPEFDSLDDWHDWLDGEQSIPGKRTFAVLHQSWGLIGVVSLTQYHDFGFFYYWIGPDFQGLGFGPQAVRLLLRHAQDQAGLRLCFAKAYQDNHRSIGGLRKLGFNEFPVQTQFPESGERFYCLTDRKDYLRDKADLMQLLEFMNASTTLI